MPQTKSPRWSNLPPVRTKAGGPPAAPDDSRVKLRHGRLLTREELAAGLFECGDSECVRSIRFEELTETVICRCGCRMRLIAHAGGARVQAE